MGREAFILVNSVAVFYVRENAGKKKAPVARG